jgi:hypothetical protein
MPAWTAGRLHRFQTTMYFSTLAMRAVLHVLLDADGELHDLPIAERYGVHR